MTPRSKPQRRLARRALACLCAIGLLATAAPPAAAQGAMPLIRDAEIEGLLKDYMTPIYRAAGQNPNAIEIVLIRSRVFNAFVADGRRIFVNVGTLIDAKTPNEIIGVLAHETGHIAGGHLARLRQQLDSAQTMAIVAMLLGAGAIGAAAAGGGLNNGGAGAAMGAAMAPQEMLKRSLLSYQRSEEQAADRAAVSYLTKTGQSAKGMLVTFKRFADQIAFSQRFIDPYAQSHPMPRERIQNLENIAKESPSYDAVDPPALQARHELMRAKLLGFLETTDGVARRYPAGDQSLPARYARAIAAYRYGQLDAAIAQIDALIAAQPQNPWFHELKGQAYLENGRAALAVPPLRRAIALAPRAPLIRTMLGQAMVAGGVKGGGDAVKELQRATARDVNDADGYRQLAIAYANKGKLPEADLASAQAAFASKDYGTARQLAERAKRGLKTGTPAWLRADDIASYKPASK